MTNFEIQLLARLAQEHERVDSERGRWDGYNGAERVRSERRNSTAFRVSAPGTVVAGQPFALTVTAIDPWGNTASTYSGTVHFSSIDLAAQLPDDYTFGTADGGTHTFDAALQTPGLQIILIQDTRTASLAIALSLVVEDSPAPWPSEGVGFTSTPFAHRI